MKKIILLIAGLLLLLMCTYCTSPSFAANEGDGIYSIAINTILNRSVSYRTSMDDSLSQRSEGMREFFINENPLELNEVELAILRQKINNFNQQSYTPIENFLNLKSIKYDREVYDVLPLSSDVSFQENTIGFLSISHVLLNSEKDYAVLCYKFFCGSYCGFEECLLIEKKGRRWLLSNSFITGEY